MTESIDEAMNRGWQHHQAGRFELARQVYESVIHNFPNHANAYHLLGRIELELARPEAALELLKAAIEREPDNGVFHYHQARVFQTLNQSENAERAFEKSTQQ